MLDKIEIYPYQRISAVNERPRGGPHITALLQRVKVPPVFKTAAVPAVKPLLTWSSLGLSLCALLMARAFVLGELLPFAFAWLASFGFRNKARAALIAVATILGFLSVQHGSALGRNIIACALLLGVISYAPLPREKNWWGLPLITFACVFVSKTVFMLLSELSFYQEMVTVFEAIIAGILCFVFLVVRDSLQSRKPLVEFSFEDLASFLVAGIGLIMGLTGIKCFGLSLAGVLCRLGILVAALIWGSGGGTMVGVMAGIIPSLSSSVFAQSLGLYAISGLLAGMFRNFGRLGIIIGFMLGNLALSMFISETQATILGMWETGAAALLFMLLPESLKEKLPVQSLGTIDEIRNRELKIMDAGLQTTARQRIAHLAGVFDELSSSFGEDVPGTGRVSRSGYLNYLYEELADKFCHNCSRYDLCWERDSYSTSQEILDIFALAENGGEVNLEQCPPGFRRRCVNGREMVNSINHLFDKLRINEYWSGKLNESRELVSRQLQGVSQVIKNLAAEIDMELDIDYELRKKLFLELKQRSMKVKNLTPVRSGAQLYLDVQCESCGDHQYCETEVASMVSGIMGQRVVVCDKKCPRFPTRSSCSFTLTRALSYRVSSGAAQVAREKVCGDSFTIATLKEGKELVALSDGMGIGEKAAQQSQAAVRLLENLLNCGFDRDLALQTINSVLLLRSCEESFATIDMLVIDLYSGELDVVKVGAAPSFLKRGRNVAAISASSPPVGILEEVEAACEKRYLCPRDMLVMVSDGVLEISRQAGADRWLPDFLSSVDENDPQRLAELLMNKAMSLCKGKPADDMSIICMYIDVA
ncbi:stage II sporulation protein E [Syntrophomonas palmitatica]|uniref:stage II sporulation protein E n=1 Tax=Syntrophomonas palmitatica TaxID=402877 RepID=UPI0006CFE36F|nr:stage II sporulation protein E [Syntrophomonas palmitatica]